MAAYSQTTTLPQQQRSRLLYHRRLKTRLLLRLLARAFLLCFWTAAPLKKGRVLKSGFFSFCLLDIVVLGVAIYSAFFVLVMVFGGFFRLDWKVKLSLALPPLFLLF